MVERAADESIVERAVEAAINGQFDEQSTFDEVSDDESTDGEHGGSDEDALTKN